MRAYTSKQPKRIHSHELSRQSRVDRCLEIGFEFALPFAAVQVLVSSVFVASSDDGEEEDPAFASSNGIPFLERMEVDIEEDLADGVVIDQHFDECDDEHHDRKRRTTKRRTRTFSGQVQIDKKSKPDAWYLREKHRTSQNDRFQFPSSRESIVMTDSLFGWTHFPEV
jgi:hypothetical protein